MQLRHRHDRGCLRRPHEGAGIDIAQPDPPVEGCDNGAEPKIDLRGVDQCGIDGDGGGELTDGRLRRLNLLLGSDVPFGEFGVADHVCPGTGQQRLILLLLRQGGVQRGLVGAGVDHCQQVALFDFLSFGNRDLHQLAVDLGAQQHRIIGLHGAEAANDDRHVLADHFGDGNGNRRRRWRGVRRVRSPRGAGPREQQRGNTHRQGRECHTSPFHRSSAHTRQTHVHASVPAAVMAFQGRSFSLKSRMSASTKIWTIFNRRQSVATPNARRKRSVK